MGSPQKAPSAISSPINASDRLLRHLRDHPAHHQRTLKRPLQSSVERVLSCCQRPTSLPGGPSSTCQGRAKGRISAAQRIAAIVELETILTQVDHIEVTEALAHLAGELAQAHGLRGYDAVHLAGASAIADSDVVLVTGDSDLANAANLIGIAVSITNA